MYKKLHRRLSLLFTLASGAILIIMSVSYLYMSEKDMTENSFLSFSSKVNSLTSGLEQQTMLTWEWLSKNAGQGLLLALYDNGSPVAYNRTVLTKEESLLVDEVKAYTEKNYPQLKNGSSYYTVHREFSYTSPEKETFHACVFHIRKNHGVLTGILLSSTKPFLRQIKTQRLKFAPSISQGFCAFFCFPIILPENCLNRLWKREKNRLNLSPPRHMSFGRQSPLSVPRFRLQKPPIPPKKTVFLK